MRARAASAGGIVVRILMLLAVMIVISVVGFDLIEGLVFEDAVYLALATLTTVGYGDIVPVTTMGRWFSTFIMLGGVGVGFYAIGALAAFLVEGRLGRLVEERRMRKQVESLTNHFIICGFSQVAELLAEDLDRAGADFVVVERDPEKAQAAMESGWLVVQGDATDDAVLTEARVEHARGLATVISDDAENLYITVSSRALHPGLPIVARGSRRRGGRYLAQAGASSVVMLDDLGASRISRSLLHPEVVAFLEEMMSPELGAAGLSAVKLPQSCFATGRTLKEINLRARMGIQVLAIKREGRYVPNPGPDETLSPNDVLLVVGTPEGLGRLETELETGA